MTQKLPGENYPLRISAAVLLLLGGFFFPLLLLPGALIAWSLISDLRNPTRPEDHPFFNPKLVPASDPSWTDRWVTLCESPAESGFLKAVIDAYGLSPSNGKLVGEGLSFDLQVKLPPYRVDFLANDRLVVEVDGAAYHSSPVEVERDAARDETLRSRGYSILRIPARLVFNSPGVAVDRLRIAVANLSAPQPLQQPVAQQSISEQIADLLEETKAKSRAAISIKTDGFSSDIERRVMAEAAEQESARSRDLLEKLGKDPVLAKFYFDALARVKESFPTNAARAVRIAEEAAMDAAVRKRGLEAKLDADPDLRKLLESMRKMCVNPGGSRGNVGARTEACSEAKSDTQTEKMPAPLEADTGAVAPVNLGRLDANTPPLPPGRITNVKIVLPWLGDPIVVPDKAE